MAENMRAIAVQAGQRDVRILEHPVPTLAGPSQVKLRMLDIGVCGTDREICAFEYGTPPAGFEHLVIGHESLGEVVEVGAGVSTLKPGDLVVPMVRRPCPHDHCTSCRAGRQDFCFTGDFRERGIKEAHGFMTEFVVDEEQYMNHVPGDLRQVGVLVEPLTIAEKALLQLPSVQGRLPWGCGHALGADQFGHCRKAVVIGAGPVGMLGAMALVVAGFEVTVYSRERQDSPKAALARSFDAKYVSAEDVPLETLAEVAGPIDLVYEAVGSSNVVFALLPHLGPNGVFVLTGVPALKGPRPVDGDTIMRNMVLRNQVVLGTVNAGKPAFQKAIRDLQTFRERWPQAVAGLITGRYPIDAYRDLLLGPPEGIKNVITFGAAS